ncbi:MAG: hypothetical protein R3F02_06295 [Thiolinea sp.]
MLYRQRVYNFYNIKLINKYEYIYDINELDELGAKEIKEVREIWDEVATQNNDNGFGRDKDFWNSQYQSGEGKTSINN